MKAVAEALFNLTMGFLLTWAAGCALMLVVIGILALLGMATHPIE